MRSAAVLPWLVVSTLASCSDSDRLCSLKGCLQGTSLNLATPLSEAGEYRVEIVADGVTIDCTAVIPYPPQGTVLECDPAIFIRRETPQYGADAAPGAETITAVWVTGEHDSISMTIARDGAELLSTEVRPEYRGVEINGEGCGECPQAEHTVGN